MSQALFDQSVETMDALANALRLGDEKQLHHCLNRIVDLCKKQHSQNEKDENSPNLNLLLQNNNLVFELAVESLLLLAGTLRWKGKKSISGIKIGKRAKFKKLAFVGTGNATYASANSENAFLHIVKEVKKLQKVTPNCLPTEMAKQVAKNLHYRYQDVLHIVRQVVGGPPKRR